MRFSIESLDLIKPHSPSFPVLGTLLLAGCLLGAVPRPLGAALNSQPAQAQTDVPLAPSTETQKAPADGAPPPRDMSFNFDPTAGTPPQPSRPKQVPMIVLVIVWLSVVTFLHLRRGRDEEPPVR